MSDLKSQKRLAASVLGVGKRKIYLDPSHLSEIANANSRQNIKRLHSDGYIIVKPNVIHSRSRVIAHQEAKAKGRHSGFGKRKGTADARMPTKVRCSSSKISGSRLAGPMDAPPACPPPHATQIPYVTRQVCESC